MSQNRRSSGTPRTARTGALLGIVFGTVAMFLLWVLSIFAPLLLALLTASILAGVGGAVAASRLRRGPAGANLAGLYSLVGVVIGIVPLLLLGSNPLTGVQVIFFGLALAAISAMGGQLSGGR